MKYVLEKELQTKKKGFGSENFSQQNKKEFQSKMKEFLLKNEFQSKRVLSEILSSKQILIENIRKKLLLKLAKGV